MNEFDDFLHAIEQEQRPVTEWPEPQPLGGELPAVQPFRIELLPERLRGLVEDTAGRMQVPLDFPAVVTVLCLAGVVGRRARIQPKSRDVGWIEVGNLWGGIVASPGMMKSPVIAAIMQPLTQIERLWRMDYQAACDGYEVEIQMKELQETAWKHSVVAAHKKGKSPPSRPDLSITKPCEKRLIINDATPEKLHEILAGNPAGVIMYRDELAGWLARLDEEGHGGEREFWLMCWNGNLPYSIDRIGRGSVHGDHCCTSIIGGIQPARLRNYLIDALHDGPQNDGLFQRFQILIYPDNLDQWHYIDRPPNGEAIVTAEAIYDRLVQLDVEQARQFTFDAEAQQLFIAWLTELEGKLRSDIHPALVSHLAKYRGLMPRLSLLFELADNSDPEAVTVSLCHAQQAAAMCEYLESHARRIYSMVISPERQAAAELGTRLKQGWRRDAGQFTVRDIYNNGWRGLGTPEAVRKVLPILEDAGWICLVPPLSNPERGRPSELYTINPKIWRTK
jgi:putative DNA primase/helicase